MNEKSLAERRYAGDIRTGMNNQSFSPPSSEDIEMYIHARSRSRVPIPARTGMCERNSDFALCLA